MSVTSDRSVTTLFSGQISAGFETDATQNLASPGQMDVVSLTTGTNTITVPSSGTTITTVAVTIIPPPSNTEVITLKGAGGDTGVKLHVTDPSSIGLDTTQTTIVLTVAAQIDGVRFIWS